MIFDDKKINKNIFYRSRKPFNLNNININKIITSKEISYGKKNSIKYFIGYNDEEGVIRPLLLKRLQMIGYLKEFDGNMTMSFRIDDNKLLKNIIKHGKQLKVY